MRLPDGRFWPVLGTRTHHGRPEVGMLVAYDFAVWRVIRIDVRQPVDWSDEDREHIAALKPQYREERAPYRIWLRPAANTSDDHPSKKKHGDICGGVTALQHLDWEVYPDEHYPACAHCGGPVPCRYTEARKAGERAVEDMERYETPGVCPSCGELVTHRQASKSWADNVEIPGGPTVIFHLRRKCAWDAMAYDKRWVAADPENRHGSLYCTGRLTAHNDGTYECTELAYCPGPTAEHPSRGICADPECLARGAFGCFLPPTAVRRGSEGLLA